MADSYWISNVGGDCVVGGNVYSGASYVPDYDDDTEDNQYSSVAGLFEGEEVECLGDSDVEAALWDDSEEVRGDGSLVGFFEIFQADLEEYNDALGFLQIARGASPKVTRLGNWTLVDIKHGASNWKHKGDANSSDKVKTDYVSIPAHAAMTPSAASHYTKKLDSVRANRIRCAKTGKGCDKGSGGVFKSVGKAFGTVAKPLGKIGKGTIGAINEAAKLPGNAVKATLGKIPIVGSPIAAAVNLTPEQALSGLTAKVLKGERLDKAFLSSAKEQIASAREVAPYVQTVMSVVPGVGSGVAAAIAAGTALAEGRTITDAVLDAARNAVPGGPLGKAAFDVALAASKGKRVDKIALQLAAKQLPPAAQAALKTTGDAAKLLQSLRAKLPPQAQKALEVGTALGAARNIQSNVLKRAVTKKQVTSFAKDGAKVLKKAVPSIKRSSKGLSKPRKAGYQAALGVLARRGSNPQTIAAIRERLGSAQKAGFDHGLKAVNEAAHPEWSTLVKGGRVIRGNFRQARKGEKGAVRGRLVKGGKVVKGNWVRA